MSDYFVHALGLCETDSVGARSKIWAFSHVLPGARLGSDCNICDHVFIENDVVVGDRVTVKSGVQLWDGLRVEDDVFIGPNATFSNDRFPRSKRYPDQFLTTTIQRGASIGAHATILPGLTIGQHAMVGAGSIVTKDVPPRSVVVGHPARIKGYVDTTSADTIATSSADPTDPRTTKVKGVALLQLPLVTDLRGSLSVGEVQEHVPFSIKRYFLVFDVKSSEVRGEHAHISCHQFLVCVRGRVSVVADDGAAREQYDLSEPNVGLYLPPMTWSVQYLYSPDAILLVLASEHYDSTDYIRDYEDFRDQLKRT